MTLKEARQAIVDNQKLIGKKFKGDEISELVIIPGNGDNLANIIYAINLGYSYENYLVGYRDFYIIALMDFDKYRISGTLYTRQLNEILAKVKG